VFPLYQNTLPMETLPLYISILFGVTTLLTIYLFYKASRNSKVSIVLVALWLIFQSIVSLTGFYTHTDAFPPRFPLLILPPLLLIILLFVTTIGKRYIDSLDPKALTLLHAIRVPVEIVLYLLCLHKTIPEIMTFEGRNLDILSGLTAPVIHYFGFVTKRINKHIILLWNFICLGLLANIVTTAILSAPMPFQQLAFDQPNIAVLYFPFTWLPCCVVPLVLFAHLVTIRKLLLDGTTRASRVVSV
jgi:hypothetical protein